MRETFFQYSCLCDHLTGQQPQLLIAARIYRVGVAGLGPRPVVAMVTCCPFK